MGSKHMVALRDLTEKQKKFVQFHVSGMSQTASARAAGYKHPNVEGYQLMRSPAIQAAVRAEQGKHEHASNMSRKKVIDGLKEAIDIARDTSEPAAMVGGWREIAKICGYYAPETKRIDISVNGAVHISQLENMTDEELVRAIIEGESTVVDDDDAPAEEGGAQLQLIESTDDDVYLEESDPE